MWENLNAGNDLNAAFIPKACMADAFGQVFRLAPGYPLPSHPDLSGQ